MNRLYDKLTGILVGIARATDGNEHLITSELTAFVMDALAVEPGVSDQELQNWIARATQFKRDMVPNCFLCDNPCGRTSDYVLSNLEKEPAQIRDAKLQMLQLVRAAALSGNPEASSAIYDGLYVLGMELDTVDYLVQTIEKLKK